MTKPTATKWPKRGRRRAATRPKAQPKQSKAMLDWRKQVNERLLQLEMDILTKKVYSMKAEEE